MGSGRFSYIRNPTWRRIIQMKRITLIKIVVVMVLLVVLIYGASCAKRSLIKEERVKRGKPGEEFIVQRSDSQAPKWVFDEEFLVTKEKREKVIYVLADIQHKERRAAERISEGELRKRVAEGIKTLVDSQFREALAGTDTTFSQAFESYVATVADNVPVVGLVVVDTYWEKIKKFKTKKEAEYFYRIVKRAEMPYDNYVKSRNKAWQDVLNNIQNEVEREELNRLLENMKRGDEV
jgi:hypothetical protein